MQEGSVSHLGHIMRTSGCGVSVWEDHTDGGGFRKQSLGG